MSLADWRNLALVYFIVIGIVAALLPGIAFFVCVKGMRLLRQEANPYIRRVRLVVRRTERATNQIARAVVKPFVFTAGTSARIQFHLGQVLQSFRR